MAKLADAYGSGPYGGDFMQVQVLFPAPNKHDGSVNRRAFFILKNLPSDTLQ